jgi:nickel superoxide dismutase
MLQKIIIYCKKFSIDFILVIIYYKAMIKKYVLSLLARLLPTKTAYAHCDIPCGIYDPHMAQLATHTIIRMSQLLSEVNRDNETKAEHDIARMTNVKENHVAILEKELDTLENDYFKEEHFKDFPDLEKLFSDAVKLSAKVRQNIDITSAEQLLETILSISEIFYKTKKLEPVRVNSPYPTQREIVIYK